MKLAELDLLADAAGEPPVLLLDDVLSELDVAHRSMIVATIAAREAQVCVTATDESDLASPAARASPRASDKRWSGGNSRCGLSE